MDLNATRLANASIQSALPLIQ